jgi:hypothetical protein
VGDVADAVGTAVDAKHLKGIAAADQENARLRDERAKSPDGMVASERAMASSASKKTACPNCGSTEVTEDGDCAKCYEPNVAARKGKRAKKATSSPTAAKGGTKAAKATTNRGPRLGRREALKRPRQAPRLPRLSLPAAA